MKDFQHIFDKYNRDRLQIPDAYNGSKGFDMLWPRFERALSNQIESGEATVSRYAIWAETIRDNIIQAMNEMENGKADEGKRLLVGAVNSLSAFAEVQAYFDPLGTLPQPPK